MSDEMKLLGHEVTDMVTGFKGVVTSISFDLYGCIQAIVTPGADMKKPAELADSRWFDAKRLKVTSKRTVMEVPTFATVIGPAGKPSFPSGLRR